MATVPRPTVKPLRGWQHAVPKGTVASQLGLQSMLEAPARCPLSLLESAALSPRLICPWSGLCHLERSAELPKVTPSVSGWAGAPTRHVCFHHPCPFHHGAGSAVTARRLQPPSRAVWSSSPRPLPFLHLFPFPCRAQLSPFPHSPSLPPLEHFVTCSLGRALLQDPALEMFTVLDEQQICTSTVYKFASCFHIEATWLCWAPPWMSGMWLIQKDLYDWFREEKRDRQGDESELPACPPFLSSWWVISSGQRQPSWVAMCTCDTPQTSQSFWWAPYKGTDAWFSTWRTLEGMYILE